MTVRHLLPAVMNKATNFSALIYHARSVLEKLKARFDNVLYAAKDYRVSFSDRCMLRVLN